LVNAQTADKLSLHGSMMKKDANKLNTMLTYIMISCKNYFFNHGKIDQKVKWIV